MLYPGDNAIHILFSELDPRSSHSPPTLQLFLAPGPPLVDPLPPQGPTPSGAARGAASGGAKPASAEPRGAEPEGAELVGAESEGAELGGAESEGAESGGAEPRGFASHAFGVELHELEALPLEALDLDVLELLVLEVLELLGAGDTGAGGAGARGAGAGDPGAGGTGARGSGAEGNGAGGIGAGDPGGGGVGARGAGAGGTGAGGIVQRRPFFVPPPPLSLPPPDLVLHHGLSIPSSTGLTPSLLCPPPHQSQPQLQPGSPGPAPSPYAKQTDSLTERRDPQSCLSLPVRAVRTGRRVPCPRPPPFPSTHIMALCPSSVPLRVPLLSPLASSLADGLDPESELVRVASPTLPRLLSTVVTDPSFESTSTSALDAEIFYFVVACRLVYASILVAEFEYDCPPSVGVECALGTDVLEDRQEVFEYLAAAVPHFVAMLLEPEGDPGAPDILTPRSYAEAITGPYSSQWQAAMDAEMASWKSTGTYVDAVPPSGANIVDGMWILRA
ncbi:unnamed protein product [Closterium sp. NIES-53]